MTRSTSRSIPVAWLLVAGLAGLAGTARADDERLRTAVVRFASVEQGRAVLGSDDAWVEATSDFQRAATLGVPPPVSTARLRAFAADAVRPWPADQQARWRRALDVILPRFAVLHLPVPPEFLLIDTDGSDAAGNPYTRGNAVALPSATLRADDPKYSDVVLLAHEMFHIVSRNSPAFATLLYRTIGFESVPLLQWPSAWLPLRIANPDAPFDRHAMRVSIEGRATMLMPLLVARRSKLKAGETFFDVLDVRLLEVTVSNGQTLPVMVDGQPLWHAPEAVPEYLTKLGGNTGYVIHPEETMADNVAFLVARTPVKNPALLKRIEAVLMETR
jgi:hypothetical protein